MKFKIVAVGKIKENYLKQAIAEYVKRISRFASCEIVEVDECAFNGTPGVAQMNKIVGAEGQGLLQKAEGMLIALDIGGKQFSSEELARFVERAEQTHSIVTFLIGGSYGLSDEVKSRADVRLSFGKITLPHQLCRVVLCEQIYRACTIRHNVPYHK